MRVKGKGVNARLWEVFIVFLIYLDTNKFFFFFFFFSSFFLFLTHTHIQDSQGYCVHSFMDLLSLAG